jgi:hypothetical protein
MHVTVCKLVRLPRCAPRVVKQAVEHELSACRFGGLEAPRTHTDDEKPLGDQRKRQFLF